MSPEDAPVNSNINRDGTSQYEVYVVVFGSLGDQRLTGRNREHFGAIGQVFGQLTITGDKPLSRESLYAETPTTFSSEPV